MKNQDLEDSSKWTYHTIWKNFLKFFDEFDQVPDDWEDKLVMYAAHLGNTRHAPATVSSYCSAIRYKLRKDGVILNEKSLEIAAIVRSCKKLNNRMYLREPLHKHMLHAILDKIDEHLQGKGQNYLAILYKAIFVMAYYGFLRIGEVAASKHALKNRDVKVAKNKETVLVILRSSKTHNAGDRPKDLKIPQVVDLREKDKHNPYFLIDTYKKNRPTTTGQEQFFVHQDGSPVKQGQTRTMLKTILKLCGYDSEIYDFHSWRTGRCHDLLAAGVELAIVKKWGRWKDDNTVMKYFRI